MVGINVIAVGKVQKGFMSDGCAEYARRLGAMCSFRLIELDEEPFNEKNASPTRIEKALEKEGERILAAIPRGSYVIPMCIEGKMMSSEELARTIADRTVGGYPSFTFIIGSSHGLSEKVKRAGDLKLSFSRMTFPHQLFRVMLLEQIYRALSINSGSKYHK